MCTSRWSSSPWRREGAERRGFLPQAEISLGGLPFDHVGQYLKGYRLHLSYCVFFGGAIGHYPGKVWYGSQDSTVLLPFQFDADRLDLNHGCVLL